MEQYGEIDTDCMFLVSCGSVDRLAEECLDVAEACMETNPDSAYSSLQCLALREDLTGEQRARYALLRTQAFVGSEQAFEGVEDISTRPFTTTIFIASTTVTLPCVERQLKWRLSLTNWQIKS